MKKIIRFSLLILPFVIAFSLFFTEGSAFAQAVKPPTLLPAEDVDIGGAADVCMGLADMIRSGNIHLRNIPCFIKYFTQTLVGLAGTLSVIFVMVGGYRYIIGRDEDKDAAKKTITYALIGLAVSLLAWVLIDIVLQVTTE